jgi:hypothetical protein
MYGEQVSLQRAACVGKKCAGPGSILASFSPDFRGEYPGTPFLKADLLIKCKD